MGTTQNKEHQTVNNNLLTRILKFLDSCSAIVNNKKSTMNPNKKNLGHKSFKIRKLCKEED